MSFLEGSKPALPAVPGAPPPAPLFGSQQVKAAGQRQKGNAEAQAGTFLGAASNPPSTGTKTLLGQ